MYKSITKILIYVVIFSFFFPPAPIVHAGILSRPPTNLGLVGYWPMDEGAGGVISDASGQRNIGAITGATWTNGKHGKALNFNGTSDFVNVEDKPSLNPINITMSAWVKTSTSGKYIIAKDPSAGPNGPGTMSTSTISGGVVPWDRRSNGSTGNFIDFAKVEDATTTVTSALGADGGGPCLESHTTISTQNGNAIIKDLKVGDLVSSYNQNLQVVEFKKVLAVFHRPILEAKNKYYRIFFDGGEIKATYNHVFYVKGELVRAENLKIGDELFNITGLEQTITNIIIEPNFTDDVWDISVEDNNNFFANGVLVHNAGVILDNSVVLLKGGTPGGTDKASVTAWGISLANSTYGGVSDTWGQSWSASEINSSDFGVAISAKGSGFTGFNYKSDYLKATNFGFSIPDGSTINGITAIIKKSSTQFSCSSSATCAEVDYISISVDYTPSSGKTTVPYALSTVSGGQFLIMNSGTSYSVTSSASVADNFWHHLVGTYDGTTMKIYRDGVLTGSSNSFSGNLPSLAGALHIGADYQSTPGNFFSGSIDDVRIYNRALTASEISKMYSSGAVRVLSLTKPIDENLPANSAIGLIRQNCTGYSYCATSLSAWQTMMLGGSGPIDWTGCTAGDLVCKNKTAVAKIDGPWSNPDATPVTINGWVTGANNSIKIYTTSSARHDGKWNNSKYRLYVSDANTMNIYEDYVNVTGLQIGGYGYTAHDKSSIFIANQTNGSNQINISESVLYRTHTPGIIGQGVYVQSSYSIVNIWNSVIVGAGEYNWSNRNACVYVLGGVLKIYNSTLVTPYGNGLARDGGTVTAKNVYAKASDTTNYFGTITKINSASADSTGSPGFQNIAYTTANFVNVTAGSENLHLTVNSGLRNVGASTSGDSPPLNFSTDVDNQIRTGGLDIGADEYSETVKINSSQNNKLTNGLVGMWSFNGADMNWASGVAYDRSGSGNNGTLVNMSTTTSPVAGKLGQALKFGGINNYVSVADSDSFSPSTLSIGAWIKWDGLRYDSASTKDWATIISKGNFGSGEYTILMKRDSAQSTNTFNFYINGSLRTTYVTTLNTNWHHLFVTYSGSSAKTFLDGVNVAEALVSPTIPNTANDLNIGRESLGGSSYFWGGLIDEVRIYNRALSADEVKQLYNMGK